MPSLNSILAKGRAVEAHRPWPRVWVTGDLWTAAAHELASERATLLGLWGEAGATYAVHLALMDEQTGQIAVVSLLCPEKDYPSVGALHAPAIRLERALHSLYGLRPIGTLARSRFLGHPISPRRAVCAGGAALRIPAG
jgi:Ni,Fe-hydrogenase III component G